MLTKTNYIVWRDCKKNAWLKVHKPEVYFAQPLSSFEQSIIETGNEVDLLARELLPAAQFQKKFEVDGYMAITDILTHSTSSGQVNLYEVKATNEIDKKTHLHDITFQYIVLKKAGVEVESANLIHLNSEYVRDGELKLDDLFMIEDVTEKVREMMPEVEAEMEQAKNYIEREEEPHGPCDCIYKGRSAHCTTFSYSNPHIPEYGVHDLTRIGLSKKKLLELVDGHKFKLEEVPEDMELSDFQKSQIWTYLTDKEIIKKEGIAEEFEKLSFPLYFLDYETYPAAVPLYDQFSPYQQIPFQYSLHILDTPESEPRHVEFLYEKADDPSPAFAKSLKDNLGTKGSIIVWHKSFELSRNKELAERLPEYKNFFDEVKDRTFDLEDIFKKLYHVHKDYYGSTSIKYVLPVLVPELSYKELAIREGGTASMKWNELVTGDLSNDERELLSENLRAYCKLDTYAMYAIWKKLYNIINWWFNWNWRTREYLRKSRRFYCSPPVRRTSARSQERLTRCLTGSLSRI